MFIVMLISLFNRPFEEMLCWGAAALFLQLLHFMFYLKLLECSGEFGEFFNFYSWGDLMKS
jgi:uncharacterized membrane protein YjfL (UPF0719 family)